MPLQSASSDIQVAAIRQFNRFYTRRLGLLNQGLLESVFSLTEARLLYEVASRDGLTATDLRRELNLDAGYLSRLLKKFVGRGLIKRIRSQSDARQFKLVLTAAGRAAFGPLDRASHAEISAMLEELSAGDAERLVGAVKTAQRLLGGGRSPPAPYILRSLKPGDIGWITHRQGLLYSREYGWDETFEALVAEILGAFVTNFSPESERCWIAERDGEIIGSVFLARGSDQVARLRLLYVEPSARGLGIGRRLVEECITFARTKGYRTLTLWTNDVLASARRIYQAAGFKLVKEERHHSFGNDLVGQNWDRDLASGT